MRRRTYLAAAVAGGAAGLAGCTALGRMGILPGEDDEYDVGMTRNEFVPEELVVSTGETVVWKNTSGADHTVTGQGVPEGEYFASGGFDDYDEAFEGWYDDRGGAITTRETYEHTFETPGEYDYVCIPHIDAGMVGVVVVE